MWVSCQKQNPAANYRAVRGNLRYGREGTRGGLSWLPEDSVQQCFDKHIIAQLYYLTRGEHYGVANNAVAMTEFNRTSRPSPRQ